MKEKTISASILNSLLSFKDPNKKHKNKKQNLKGKTFLIPSRNISSTYSMKNKNEYDSQTTCILKKDSISNIWYINMEYGTWAF